MTKSFAILTPVPEQHLRSALDVPSGIVALGSDREDFFAEVETAREARPVPLLIYASTPTVDSDEPPAVSWRGWYVGLVRSRNGAHPAGDALRPESTKTDGAFKVFYHVADLRELSPSEVIRVDSLRKYKKAREARSSAPVRGPSLVLLPDDIRR